MNFKKLFQKVTLLFMTIVFISSHTQNFYGMSFEKNDVGVYSDNTTNNNTSGSALATTLTTGVLGTKTNPYLVGSRAELEAISQNLEGYYKLTANIDLENQEWIPIGNNSELFKGGLDGNGFKISNLKINESKDRYVGLFGIAEGASFENITIENVDITTTGNAGALVGEILSSKIDKCAVIGKGLIYVTSGYSSVGGLIGQASDSPEITKSFSTINVRGGVTGGFIGELARSYITDCFATGTVNEELYNASGFVGSGYDSTIENCYYAGQIFGNNVKGLVSDYSSIAIINSYFNSTITDITTPLENAKNTNEMTLKSTFVGWDFDNTWSFDNGFMYPYLKEINVTPVLPKGSISNPYLIETKAQLKEMLNNLGGYYKLTADIDLENEEWVPVGTYTAPFKGGLDGNGFKITNLKIKESQEVVIGLFGYAYNATFENVIIENVDIEIDSTYSIVVGVLAGSIGSSKVNNCKVTGEASVYIVNTAQGTSGGLIGDMYLSKINNSSSTSKLKGGRDSGGLVANVNDSSITNCFATGAVDNVSYSAGSFVGILNYSSITNCFATGTVGAGSIFGSVFIGSGYRSTIENCYYAGLVSGDNDKVMLGLPINDSQITIKNSYFDSTLAGITTPLENARTTSEMMLKSTFVGWDFSGVWDIKEDDSYPFLRGMNGGSENETDELEIIFDDSGMTKERDDLYLSNDKIQAITGRVTDISHLKSLKYEISLGKLIISSGDLPLNKEFSIENIILQYDSNSLTVKAVLTSGKEISKSIKIFNSSEENSVGLVLDEADNDSDKLLNYIEDIIGTDKNKSDTDVDGLTDYEEFYITHTDPLKVDSDENGVNDVDEDPDEDGVSNLMEISYNGNPFLKDTDFDWLDDSEEIKLGTKLDNMDTDSDKFLDNVELIHGTDPLNPDTNGNGIFDGDESYTITVNCSETEESDPVKVSVTVDISGEKLQTLSISKVSDSGLFLSKNIPGFIGNAFEFTVDATFTTAHMKFEFENENEVSNEFVPRVYYFDEEKQLLIELPDQTIVGNTVSVNVTHFSKYILINKVEFDKAFDDSLLKTAIFNTTSHVMLSMIGNDSIDDTTEYLDLIKTTTEDFFEKLPGTNSLGSVLVDRKFYYTSKIVDFKTKSDFTISDNDKLNDLIKSLDIEYVRGASISAAIMNGVNEFVHYYNNIPGPYPEGLYNKTMVILSDAMTDRKIVDDQDNPVDLKEFTDYAVLYGIKIHTISFVSKGTSQELESVAEITGGKYYHASDKSELADIFDSINQQIAFDSFYLSKKLYTNDPTSFYYDGDNDDIPDVYEKNGIPLADGTKVYTNYDPKTGQDTDYDGLTDGDEIGIATTIVEGKERYYYKISTDPTRKDTDRDGISDKIDSEPLTFNVTDRTLSLVAGLSYNNLEAYVGKTLLKFLQENYKTLDGLSLYDATDLQNAKIVYANDSGYWNDFKDRGLGSVAIEITRHKKKPAIIFALRGSEFGKDFLNDLSADAILAFASSSMQSNYAELEYIELTKYKGYAAEYYIAGHSLGGRLVQDLLYKTYKYNEDSSKGLKVPTPKHSATFNGLGYNGLVYMSLKNDILDKYKTTLTNYYYLYDMVGDSLAANYQFFRRSGKNSVHMPRDRSGNELREEPPLIPDTKFHGIEYFQNDFFMKYRDGDWIDWKVK